MRLGNRAWLMRDAPVARVRCLPRRGRVRPFATRLVYQI